jgi:TRAP-type C4-dicarboxylate transport system permease small subunit
MHQGMLEPILPERVAVVLAVVDDLLGLGFARMLGQISKNLVKPGLNCEGSPTYAIKRSVILAPTIAVSALYMAPPRPQPWLSPSPHDRLGASRRSFGGRG